MNNPTLLTIGDTVCDAFIELQDVDVHCDVDNTNCMLSMRFGDKIPFKDDIIVYGVGNSANAAVSASRLGIQTSIITHLGRDENGSRCIDALRREGVSTIGIVSEPNKKTNYHYVLRYGPERTILVKHTDFTYDFESEIARISNPDWIYLSSLAQNTEPYHESIANWLAQHPDTKLAFQPGTFQMQLGTKKLARIYKYTEVFFCNVEEAAKILNTPQVRNIRQLIVGIHTLGPRIVCITDGPKGAYASDGKKLWYIPMYPDPAPPVERTGAGDAFSSTFTVALMQNKTIPEALQWAPINSMNVVQHIGAQAGLLSQEKIQHYLDQAPNTYTPKEL